MDFENLLLQKTQDIDAMLEGYLPEKTGYQKTIFEAMEYALLAKGKRLRPMLMQETYLLVKAGRGEADSQNNLEDVLPEFMAALECIHTYSLIHDDLPAMDDDDYRRGRLTTHKVYGEAMAILAGDALLNYAFELAAIAVEKNPCTASAKALRILTEKAGIYGMIGGQVVDVEAEKKNETLDLKRVEFVYELKTSALIEAAMMIGAALAGATEAELDEIEQVAKKVGLAFQIQDDILDLTGSFEELGKPIGSDVKNDKATYVSLVGLEKAKQDVDALSREAITILDTISGENPFLKELILSLIHRVK